MSLWDTIKDALTPDDHDSQGELKDAADKAQAKADAAKKKADEEAAAAQKKADEARAKAGQQTSAEVEAADAAAKVAQEKAAADKAAADATALQEANQALHAIRMKRKAAHDAKVAAGGDGGGGHQSYTVVSGDTLSGIGAKFGVDWHKIAEINHVENPDLIYPGQVFKIPAH